VEVVVDVVPVALGVSPPPQREVGVLQEQRAVQHTLLVNLGPEQEDLHAAGHDAGVDVLLVVVVAKRETQDDRTRTSTLHLFFLNTDKSASDRDSLLQGHQDGRTRTSTLHLPSFLFLLLLGLGFFTSRTLLQGHQDDRTRTSTLHTLTSYLPSYFFFFFFLLTSYLPSYFFFFLDRDSLLQGLYFKDIRTTELELFLLISSSSSSSTLTSQLRTLQGHQDDRTRTSTLHLFFLNNFYADKLPSFLFLLLLLPQH
jgi:hypothetical protein